MSEKQLVEENNGAMDQNNRTIPLQRITPVVDIYETDAELVLIADMPGVKESNLQVEVARGLLTLEGAFKRAEDAAKTSYYRQFKLSEQIDSGAGEAVLKDGVLTLKLPKVEEARPKKIAVKTLH